MRIRPLPALAIALLLPFAGDGAARAEGGAPEKVKLAPAVAPGKPVRFVHRLETKQEATVGGKPMPTESLATTEFSVEVAERTAAGTFRGTVRFGRMGYGLQSGLFGKHDLSSTLPLPPSGLGRLLAIDGLGLADAGFPVTLDARGAIAAVEGIPGVLEARAKALGLRPGEEALLGTAIREVRILRTLNGALVATPFPEGPVAPGHEWEDEDVVAGTSAKSEIRIRQTLRLSKVEPGEVLVEGTGKVSVRQTGAPGQGSTPRELAGESHVTSRTRISRADGLPLAATVESSVRFELGGAAVKQTMTSTLERVDAWPSAKEAAPAPGPKPPAPR